MQQLEQTTPFGAIRLQLLEGQTGAAIVLRDEAQPHAAIYAAKQLRVQRIVELATVRAVDRLLEPGDLVVPHDLVDLTSGRRSTFFVNKGYGFIPQRPVFCPEVQRALLVGTEPAALGRRFARGVLAVVDDQSQPAEARTWGAQLVSGSGAPAAYLAKELELCYAMLCVVERQAGQALDAVLAAALAALPPTPGCGCHTVMQPARQRGLVADDWRTWL